MLIGQDFGPPEKEEIKGTIANVRKMNDGIDVMFYENVDLEARDSQTDKNIVGYFELLGKNEIDKKKYPDLFFCNCNLGYHRDKYSGNMTRKILANDVAEIKSLIDIIEPENIICLGLDTSVVCLVYSHYFHLCFTFTAQIMHRIPILMSYFGDHYARLLVS